MFEKEAEDNKPPYAFCALDTNCELWKDGFQKGAGFGYNKAKEDADKMKSQFLELCNLKDMRIAELEKANEWHFVKDKGLPKLHGWYWVQYINETFDCAILSTKQRFFNFYTKEDTTDSVLAWQKIVPPELPKE